jgi:uncharacterized protein CbrC (UPF0167 family)
LGRLDVEVDVTERMKTCQSAQQLTHGAEISRKPTIAGAFGHGCPRVLHPISARAVVEMDESDGSHPVWVMDSLEEKELICQGGACAVGPVGRSEFQDLGAVIARIPNPPEGPIVPTVELGDLVDCPLMAGIPSRNRFQRAHSLITRPVIGTPEPRVQRMK